MNTTETNKKLAEFMGRKIHPLQTIESFRNIPIEEKSIYGDGDFIEDLKYHNDWNWLMSVVEKIESFIFENDEYYNFHILGGCCVYIISSHGNELVASDKGQSKLECVYNACSMFVDWYNKNVSRGTI